MEKIKAYINGNFIDNGSWLDIENPSTLSIAGQVTALTPTDIDLAFESAKKAQINWAKTPILKRINVLKRFRDLLLKNKEFIADLLAAEVAKSYKDGLTEVERTVELIDYTFEEAKRLFPLAQTGEEMGFENKLGVFYRIPKGVGLAISPFNYPINLAVAKIIPALVSGNGLVFKPATQGSLVGAYMGVLMHETELPKGLFNVVTGRGREIGDYLTAHKSIDFISFTGSVAVGKKLQKNASTSDLILELGGKDPAIVLDDLDLENYANHIVSGAFNYSGQRCTAIKRVITTNKIADKLIPLLKDKVSKLSVGIPMESPIITPIIDLKSTEFVQSLIDDAKNLGATIVCGDKREKNLMQPTLIDNVTTKMKLAWEEPFGPVLPVIRIDDLKEQIKIANESEFGLQAAVFGQNLSETLRVAKQLEAGTVNINNKTQRGPDSFPFLGIKNSGVGVQGIRESLLSMTRYQGIIINY
ncbi:NADP-dependent glyceraldehyde-3-phosphate dehydrogenase [Spiroplasma endosymbiont of Labia minor]|uniref:NADP-dependent glyceraldehyde-3-phosphate dehydrogenase n=1 Tax=Spiroplasma endosymbiont of Labia minor TaxID=3066305 RepID=UPI0030D49C1A